MSARWTDQDLAEYQARMKPKGVLMTIGIKEDSDGDSRIVQGFPRYFVVPGPPVPKPRQTSSDKWLKRPRVVRYREWADLARKCAGVLPAKPGHLDVKAFLPLPESWSHKKREAHKGQPHQSQPDMSNIIKAVEDALLPKADQCIWKGKQEKRWDDGRGPRVEITIY